MEKIKTFFKTLGSQLLDVFNRIKVFLLLAIAALVALEWDHLVEAFLVFSGKKAVAKATKQDTALATVENADNAKADVLVTQATQLEQTPPTPVADDWYKKDQS